MPINLSPDAGFVALAREHPIPSLRSLSVFAARGGLACLLLVASPLWGANDHYLSEIEEEAKRQATTLITSPTAPNSATASDTTTERLVQGLDTAAFERALRAALPGTYVLYQQLDPARQRQVYQAYRSDNRLASISAQVARLTGSGP